MAQQANWQIVESDFHLADLALNETLFALGNGYLGMRGTFEEANLPGATEGTYINGFYETAPIVYGEKFIGYAENKQTILNLANARIIRLTLGDEPFDMHQGSLLSYRRHLDMQAGVLHRSLRWQSPQGKQIQLDVDRLILHAHPHIALIRYRVTPLNFTGSITLFSAIDGLIRQSEHAEDDPRLGTQFKSQVLQPVEQGFHAQAALLAHRTLTTQFTVACAIQNALDVPHNVQTLMDDRFIGFEYHLQAQQGIPLTLDKTIAYVTSLDVPTNQVVPTALQELASAVAAGFDILLTEQRRYLADFWQVADILIEGDDILQRGIRFNMFHLLQSAGRDGRTNIAAKGLTGLGYEGHYFWDTEIYVMPFFLYTQPHIARKLLEYRYHILEKARQRARQMSHPIGALYSWRSINGEECSANFPTGTAQYHINADIAFAIRRYYDATQDEDFMKRFGAEILCETARLWLDVGAFIPERQGQFCISGVTGPDEYQILVSNNAYTNLMARQNLLFASEIITWLKDTDPAAYAALVSRIGLQENESESWLKAARLMYLPYDEERQIIPQDDTFLGKPRWDFQNTPKENYPLLLHYHPLVVMRYQVCKQADTVLAEFLLHDLFDRPQKQRDFDYYEPLTTHDSSLSGAIFGIVAAELGDIDKAYRYFAETATLDLENQHGNTQAGIHAANMAGTWQGIIYGFAGMRAKDGLSFAPTIPRAWRSYAFKVLYRGRLLSVRVTSDGAKFKLLSGAPIEIKVNGVPTRLEVA